MVDAIQQVQLFYAKADVSFTALFNQSLRIAKGPVTVRQIAALYPYDNELYAIEGDGKMVKDALENAARFYLSCSGARCGEPPLTNREVRDSTTTWRRAWNTKSISPARKATAFATCAGRAAAGARAKTAHRDQQLPGCGQRRLPHVPRRQDYLEVPGRNPRHDGPLLHRAESAPDGSDQQLAGAARCGQGHLIKQAESESARPQFQ